MFRRKSGHFMRVPLLLAVGVSAGVLIGATVFGGKNEKPSVDKTARKIKEILSNIDRFYVDSVNTNEIAEKAIELMLKELDPHTSYIPAEELATANEGLEGNFEGIGIEFNIFQDTLFVVAPIPGGPSEEAGLRAGDKIIFADGDTVSGNGLTNQKVFKSLKGPKGSKVKLGIMRKGVKGILDYKITRDRIPIYSVDVSYMMNETDGYLKISKFGATTYKEFQEAAEKLKKEGMKRLVLDLRDNPGGYMGMAIRAADEFIAGKKMIVYTKSKEPRFNESHYSENDGFLEKEPVIVLVNEGSASASEILAGALQDTDRALIVGRRSYGKGLVQKPISLSDGSELRLTISRYYTPSGRSVQRHYELGAAEDYSAEFYERFENGEIYHADSIKFDEKLKYKTLAGRTVYGGGGIMPDIFVARDTSYYSDWLSRLYAMNLVREYALNYAGEHKSDFENTEFETFRNTFVVSEKMIAGLIALSEERGLVFNKKEFKLSEKFVRIQMKSLIAKSFWGETGLYKILEADDEVLIEAQKHFEKAERLAKGQSLTKE